MDCLLINSDEEGCFEVKILSRSWEGKLTVCSCSSIENEEVCWPLPDLDILYLYLVNVAYTLTTVYICSKRRIWASYLAQEYVVMWILMLGWWFVFTLHGMYLLIPSAKSLSYYYVSDSSFLFYRKQVNVKGKQHNTNTYTILSTYYSQIWATSLGVSFFFLLYYF